MEITNIQKGGFPGQRFRPNAARGRNKPTIHSPLSVGQHARK
jgi:hypothetical protein